MKRIRYWIDILGLIKASSYIVWHFICVCITLSFTGENPTMTLALCYTSLNSNLTPTMQKVSPLVKPLRARGDTFRTSEKYPPRKFTRGVKFRTSQKYPPGILFRGDTLAHDTGHPALDRFDNMLKQGLSSIMNVALSDKHWKQASLPVSDGGLGLGRYSFAGTISLSGLCCMHPPSSRPHLYSKHGRRDRGWTRHCAT